MSMTGFDGEMKAVIKSWQREGSATPVGDSCDLIKLLPRVAGLS
jgi:hypothetical protein